MRLNRRAQSTLEFAALVTIIAAACTAMLTYVQRAVRANLKNIERQINIEADRD